jgi:hypothetical protein
MLTASFSGQKRFLHGHFGDYTADVFPPGKWLPADFA